MVSRYGIPVILVTTALALTLLLEKAISTRFWFFFLAAIMASAWFGGKTSGWVAVVLGIFVVDYFLRAPAFALSLRREDLGFVAAFAASSLVAGWISAERKQAELSLKQARSELEIRVAERTTELKDANEALRAEITERKQAEEALQKARAELAHLSRVTTMGELAAAIAHEVNQPLTAVVTNGNAALRWLAQDTANVEKARNAIIRMVKDGTHAGEIIHRIRSFLKKAPLEIVPLDMNLLILDVIALLRGELARNRISLVIQLEDHIPSVLGDSVQLQQVILNLIMNSMEAMSSMDGDRSLEIGSRKYEANRVLIWVRDSGVGIESDHYSNLFDPFFTTKPNGMGMGLSISRSIVEAHRGKLWASSNGDRGVTLQFTLPATDLSM